MRIVAFKICLLCFVWAAAIPVWGQLIRTVTLTGGPAAGTSADWEGFQTNLVLNSNGQAAFRAELAGNGVDGTNDYAVWSEGSGPLALVAREGDQAAGTPVGTVFGGSSFGTSFGSPVINSAGQIAFWSELEGNGVDPNNDEGIWIGDSSSLDLVARENDQAPDTAAGLLFDNLSSSPALNSVGQIGFKAQLKGAGIDLSNRNGIWFGTSGFVQLLARTAEQAPGTPSGVDFSFLNDPVVNSLGKIAFRASITGPGIDFTNDAGIWLGSVGTLTMVVREGDQAPGTAAGVNFSGLSNPKLDSAGQVVFEASLSGSGLDGSNDGGIWAQRSGSVQLIAREGEPAAGTPSGVDYGFLRDPVINSTGQTAFWGGLVGNSVDSSNDLGIWSEGLGSMQLIAREGDQAPETPSGVQFDHFFEASPVLNSNGQSALRARLTGSGVNSGNDSGLWAQDALGDLKLIVREGDQLEVAPNDFRTIQFLSFVGESGNEDGDPSGFNDLGQLFFGAIFTDGSGGLFVSNRVATSLPGDFDKDRLVTGLDFLEWQQGDSLSALSQEDVSAWESNYGSSRGSSTNISLVPEPGAAALLATCIVIVFYNAPATHRITAAF